MSQFRVLFDEFFKLHLDIIEIINYYILNIQKEKLKKDFFKLIDKFFSSHEQQSSFSSYNEDLLKIFRPTKISEDNTLFVQNKHPNPDKVKILIIGCGISICYDCYPEHKKCDLEYIYQLSHNDERVLTLDMDPYVSPHILTHIENSNHFISDKTTQLLNYLYQEFPNIESIIWDGLYIKQTYCVFSILTKNMYLYDGTLSHIMGEIEQHDENEGGAILGKIGNFDVETYKITISS